MLSKKVTCSVPKEQRPLAMSYTHGAHAPPCSIYYGGDHRVVPGQVAPLELHTAPAWLVADWMLAKARGEPLSEAVENMLSNVTNFSDGLHWLHHFCSNN